MKKMSKIISFMLIVIMLFSITTTVFAADPKDNATTKSSGFEGTPGDFTGASNQDMDVSSISGLANKIVSIITTIGMAASVIVLVVLGIKYMMGSAEEKAEYKKTLMPYVIGAAMVFAASAIATFIYNIAIKL